MSQVNDNVVSQGLDDSSSAPQQPGEAEGNYSRINSNRGEAERLRRRRASFAQSHKRRLWPATQGSSRDPAIPRDLAGFPKEVTAPGKLKTDPPNPMESVLKNA